MRSGVAVTSGSHDPSLRFHRRHRNGSEQSYAPPWVKPTCDPHPALQKLNRGCFGVENNDQLPQFTIQIQLLANMAKKGPGGGVCGHLRLSEVKGSPLRSQEACSLWWPCCGPHAALSRCRLLWIRHENSGLENFTGPNREGRRRRATHALLQVHHVALGI